MAIKVLRTEKSPAWLEVSYAWLASAWGLKRVEDVPVRLVDGGVQVPVEVVNSLEAGEVYVGLSATTVVMTGLGRKAPAKES